MQRNAQAAILAATGRYVRKLFADVEVRVKALEGRAMPVVSDPSVTVDDVRSLVDERLKALPALQLGKGFDADDLSCLVEVFVRRLDESVGNE